jgi:multiple sugar transport system ATP-binding protein
MKIVLKNLTKKFPGRGRKAKDVIAVNNFDFEIPDGKLIGLLGPSGCGKSTALNLICGLLKPTEGKIFFDETDVTDLPPENRGVGMVFQNYALYPHLTVRQNIRFPLENLKGAERPSKEEMEKKVLFAAKLVQIEEYLDRKPKELSGGQQQRVAIARALAMDPLLLLMDEPTSALDPELVGEVLQTVRSAAQEGNTILLVTHEMPFVRSVAKRVIFLENGKIVADGTAKDIFEHPANERLKRFLININMLETGEYAV